MLRVYAAILVLCSVMAGVSYCNIKKRWAAEYEAKAQKTVTQETLEVLDEQAKRKKAIERLEPGDLLKYWHGVQPDDSGGGKAAPPGKAAPDKP